MLGRREEALASLDTVDMSLPNLLVLYATALHHLIRNEVSDSAASIRN